MARNYRVSFYAVDPNDSGTFSAKMLKAAIEAYMSAVFHIQTRQLHVEASNVYDWQDGEAPEHDPNCDLAVLESRFAHEWCEDCDVHPGSIYKHFKGHLVKVLAVSRGTEYGETVVVYEHMHDHTIWHRPAEMFTSKVDKEKYPDVEQEYRFQLVKEEPRRAWEQFITALKAGC